MSPQIEEINSDIEREILANPTGGDSPPPLEGEGEEFGGDVTIPATVSERAERKCRKALQGVGLKQVLGVNRVTMKRSRGGQYYEIEPVEVYKSSVTDCYVVFGEAKARDNSAAAQAQAQQTAQEEVNRHLRNQRFAQSLGTGGESSGKQRVEEVEEEAEDESEPIDEEGVDAKDIELVMQQVSCSRRKAVKALKASNGDLINAIMSAS